MEPRSIRRLLPTLIMAAVLLVGLAPPEPPLPPVGPVPGQQQDEEPARPRPPGDPIQEALKDLIKSHVTPDMADKAKAMAKSIPESERNRLKAMARQTWARVRPQLGDDPERLSAFMRQCVSLVPPERLAAWQAMVLGVLDKRGPAAAAAISELIAKGRNDILPQFLALLNQQDAGEGGDERRDRRRPEDDVRMYRGAIAALNVRDLINTRGRTSVRESLEALRFDVTIPVEGRPQPMPLDTWARMTVREQMPELTGDGPTEGDPVATLAAALAGADLRAMMGELALVETAFGERLPATEILNDADPEATDDILAALEVLESTVRLREALKSGVDLAVAADDFARVVKGGDQ